MLKIKEAIVVEGNYDKIKLSQLVDTTIIVTDGFMIFKNKPMMQMIGRLADTCGVIVFTDSDRAGFQIRNHIKNVLSGKNIKHAYIPDIKGKEKRKDKLRDSCKEIPAAVFEHCDIFGIGKQLSVVSYADKFNIAEALPVGKAENEVAYDRNIRKNQQVQKRNDQKNKNK